MDFAMTSYSISEMVGCVKKKSSMPILTIYLLRVYLSLMTWTVTSNKRVKKQAKRLPQRIRASLYILVSEIKEKGPVRGNWSNYSALGDNKHHCHLKKGHPTYVAVWEVVDKEIKLVEITYAGTHGKAPY